MKDRRKEPPSAGSFPEGLQPQEWAGAKTRSWEGNSRLPHGGSNQTHLHCLPVAAIAETWNQETDWKLTPVASPLAKHLLLQGFPKEFSRNDTIDAVANTWSTVHLFYNFWSTTTLMINKVVTLKFQISYAHTYIHMQRI